MKKIQNVLADWVREGLLTPAQQEKILEYEQNKSKANKPKWILYGFLILGICIVGIGIISFIASNWQHIPGEVKIAADFVILCAVAFGVFWLDRSENTAGDIIFDALSAFFILLCLASIGLVSQVFHTGGKLYQGLLFWLVMILPLALCGRKNFLHHLWAAGFLTTIIVWAFSDSSFYQGSHNISLFFLTLPFFILTVANLLFSTGKGIKARWAETFGHIFVFWLLGSVIVMMFVFELMFQGHHFQVESRLLPFVILYACIVISCLTMFFSPYFSRREKIILLIIIIFTAVCCLPCFEWNNRKDYSLLINEIVNHSHSAIIEKIAGPVFSIPITLLVCMIFIIRDHRRLFNIGMLLIGLRFLVIYFQVLGNLATTALGLIISGIVIVGISFIWFKKRNTVERWFEGLLK